MQETFLSWTHAEVVLSAIGLIIVPVSLAWYSDKKDRVRMHKENQVKLDAIIQETEYHPLHWHHEYTHGEANTPLTVGGIIKKPRKEDT